MEAPPQQSPSPAPGALDRTAERPKNKVQRIGRQTRGLFEDFTSWVELRLQLFQLDVQERVKKKIDEAIIKVAPIVVGLLGGFFLLVTAALFLGWALGHPAWGFLAVTLLLFVAAGMLYARSRRLGDDEREVEITAPAKDGERSSGGSL